MQHKADPLRRGSRCDLRQRAYDGAAAGGMDLGVGLDLRIKIKLRCGMRKIQL